MTIRGASEYSDEDLIDIFWHVNRDKYPERYLEICKELEARNIPFEDVPQWEKNIINNENDLNSMWNVRDLIGQYYGYAISAIAGITFVVSYFEK